MPRVGMTPFGAYLPPAPARVCECRGTVYPIHALEVPMPDDLPAWVLLGIFCLALALIVYFDYFGEDEP